MDTRVRAVLAIFDCTYVLGGGRVLIADTPVRAHWRASSSPSPSSALPEDPADSEMTVRGRRAP